MIPATAGSSSTAASEGQSRNRPASGRPGQAAAGLPGAAPNGDGGPPAPSSPSAASASARGTTASKRSAPSATKFATSTLVSRPAGVTSDLHQLLEHELVGEKRGVVLGAWGGGTQRRELDDPPAVAHGGDHRRVRRLVRV